MLNFTTRNNEEFLPSLLTMLVWYGLLAGSRARGIYIEGSHNRRPANWRGPRGDLGRQDLSFGPNLICLMLFYLLVQWETTVFEGKCGKVLWYMLSLFWFPHVPFHVLCSDIFIWRFLKAAKHIAMDGFSKSSFIVYKLDGVGPVDNTPSTK